jgi:hypothetical protein
MSIKLPDLQRQLDTAASYFAFRSVPLEVLTETPLTILISQPCQNCSENLAVCLEFLAKKALRTDLKSPDLLFRGVELSRLATIIQTRCDVVPSHTPLSAGYAGKALEYGRANKVVEVFDSQKLERTFKKVRRSEAPEILDQLRQNYPSLKEVDSEWLWFSKLPPGDFRIGTGYEIEYSFFIPGNPAEALLMVFLVGENPEELRAEFLKWSVEASGRSYTDPTKGTHIREQRPTRPAPAST